MIRRGAANTRERDFADVWMLLDRQEIAAAELRSALEATARHRGTTLIPLFEAVENLGSVRQGAWATYRERARIEVAPEDFGVVLADIARFVDPVIIGDTRRDVASGHEDVGILTVVTAAGTVCEGW